MTTTFAVLVFFALITKHFICDFALQMHPYQYRNKGTYGHPGGLLHAFICMVGTYLALASVTTFQIVLLPVIWYILIGEGIVHYHIDYFKMKIGKKFNLEPNNSERFWLLLGFDQYLHYLTYVVIVWILGSI